MSSFFLKGYLIFANKWTFYGSYDKYNEPSRRFRRMRVNFQAFTSHLCVIIIRYQTVFVFKNIPHLLQIHGRCLESLFMRLWFTQRLYSRINVTSIVGLCSVLTNCWAAFQFTLCYLWAVHFVSEIFYHHAGPHEANCTLEFLEVYDHAFS